MTEATCLVKTDGCYAAVFDTASPAYTKGFYERETEQAKREARSRGDTLSWGWEVRFNERLSSRAKAGELLAWMLLFDGVFKTRVCVLDAISEQPSMIMNLGTGEAADLVFPSGDIVVACLTTIGDAYRQPVIQVEPGKYRVHLLRDPCEDEYFFLENLSDYPSGNGPDWTITVARLPR